jgi:dTDP-4-amino-4,6-dideoxygalactose transaminase
VRVLRDHGQSERYIHVTAYGVNARLDAFKAAVLKIKLDRLGDWNAHRRQVAAWYQEQLAATGLTLPYEPADTRHVYHQFVVRVPAGERDRIRTELDSRGVSTGLHYPIPLHLQPAFSYLNIQPGSLPHAELAASEVLSLPMHPHLTHAEVTHVASCLQDALR